MFSATGFVLVARLGVRATATNCYRIATALRVRISPTARNEFRIGSGPGIRTLNLAVNSRLLYR